MPRWHHTQTTISRNMTKKANLETVMLTIWAMMMMRYGYAALRWRRAGTVCCLMVRRESRAIQGTATGLVTHPKAPGCPAFARQPVFPWADEQVVGFVCFNQLNVCSVMLMYHTCSRCNYCQKFKLLPGPRPFGSSWISAPKFDRFSLR